MYWEEDTAPDNDLDTGKVVDVSFRINCPVIPVDYAWALYQGLTAHLPWIDTAEHTGILPLPVLAEANGWARPDAEDEFIHLPKRARLTLRIPESRKEEVNGLVGQSVQVGEYPMVLGDMSTRPLSQETTIMSHYVVADPEQDEADFMHETVAIIREMDVKPRKVLCGKTHTIGTPDGGLFTRSLMIAELKVDESLTLQQQGLGEHGHLGCGLFIPHKGISAV